MTAKLMDGKKVAAAIREDVGKRVEKLAARGVTPGLAVILVGEDPASQTYVKSKQRTCEKLGMRSDLLEFPDTLSETDLLAAIDKLNRDPGIHGILVQLPLPAHIDETHVILAIDPTKDVDGFHPISAGRLLIGEDGFVPCTPNGIMRLLDYYEIDPAGKHAVIIGRSTIVGKPAGLLLLQRNATVTFCHSKTENLEQYTQSADIVIAAVGRPGMLKAHHIKAGAVVIDVGINRGTDGKLTGDAAFDELQDKASFITPVPGGVGPMTIAMLMDNTVRSAEWAAEGQTAGNGVK
ncbi:bifunctional methylenetetrahydrofolate dehydrogenase/methenyltetrahydrofolate cyclohydrolase FolD [Planococcus lenghuensis]|uniref:Bifunctional protein FolD n=1 Tax=Planococcus lenghuensis TaxID=2213202 RepID=A0A1Q2KXZ9_9BACL|nr:bifunctional methylenetetrahydrofolate dehydrogenase/methenyltetrahydrofolate cyclohydrolase FolD [Planococcus lenghuensis]AQQ53023.1 bifunctional methylenetetrahydrofolate dehydrogenase/methenyltetrahydrofolate cyclohydrolase [Planococcus lenghuensis]